MKPITHISLEIHPTKHSIGFHVGNTPLLLIEFVQRLEANGFHGWTNSADHDEQLTALFGDSALREYFAVIYEDDPHRTPCHVDDLFEEHRLLDTSLALAENESIAVNLQSSGYVIHGYQGDEMVFQAFGYVQGSSTQVDFEFLDEGAHFVPIIREKLEGQRGLESLCRLIDASCQPVAAEPA